MIRYRMQLMEFHHIWLDHTVEIATELTAPPQKKTFFPQQRFSRLVDTKYIVCIKYSQGP